MALDIHRGLLQACPEPPAPGDVAIGRTSKRERRTVRPVDDFPRLVAGFVLGIVLTIAIGVANMLLAVKVCDFLGSLLGCLGALWGTCFFLAHFCLLTSLPIIGAGLLATQDKVQAARRTFSYCFSIVVLFVLVCGRPVGLPAAGMVVLTGINGLVGIGCVLLLHRFWFARRSRQR
jgi:hypothetical protein